MPSEKIEQTNQKEFLENYQDLLDLYKDTNKLLELNDNFSETILDLPDPEEKNTYSFESEKEEIDDKYKNFYYLRSRFYRKVSRMRENEVFLDQNLSSLTDDWRLDLVDVLNKLKVILEDLNNKRNLIDVTVLRSVLVSDLGTFRTELESIKDKISNEARKKVREISNANKKDSNIDSNTVYDYRNTAATMKKK